MESTDVLTDSAGLVSGQSQTAETFISVNNGTPPSSQHTALALPLVNGISGDHPESKTDEVTDTSSAVTKKITTKQASASDVDSTAKQARKRTPNPNAPPRSRSKKVPQQLVQVADLPQQVAASNIIKHTQNQIPIINSTNFISANNSGFNFISTPQVQAQLQMQSQLHQQSPILRGARTILPKPASGSQNVASVQQIAAAAGVSSQPTTQTPARPQVFQNATNSNHMNCVQLQSAPLTIGNQQFNIRMPTQQQNVDASNNSASSQPINRPQFVSGQQQVQAYLQTIQTANGPMTLAFLPPNINPVFPGAQQQSIQFAPPQINGLQFNGMQNFLNHQQNLIMQRQQPQPMFATPQKEESEFNLDEFLTFGTPPPEPAAAECPSIMDELVKGQLFQSPATQLVNGTVASDSSTEQQASAKPAPKKRSRSKKKNDTSGIQQKVEEILRVYKDELTVDPLVPPVTTTPLFLGQAGAPQMVNAPSFVDLIPATVKSPTPPPPPKPRRKTDLGKKRDKDLQTLETIDLNSPFKGKISALHRLLPFHLLSEPEERPEDLEREDTAFRLVSEGLVARRAALHQRYQNVLLAEAAEYVPRLDVLTCASTWLDAERAEFEAEKRAVECGMPLRLPPWIYASRPPQTLSTFFDATHFDLLCSNAFEEPPPTLPPALLMPPPPAPTISRPQITVRKSEPQSGRIKLAFKRTSQEIISSPAEPASEPPLKKVGKVLLKLARRPENGPDPPIASVKVDPPKLDDLITQNAVESILQFGDKSARKMTDDHRKHGFASKPVMAQNGPSFAYFYGHGASAEVENEPDSALDEAIQSILG